MTGYTFSEPSEIKTIILYIIDNYGEHVSNGPITDIFMEFAFVDYFTMQIYLSELVESGLLEKYDDGGQLLYIPTDIGKEAIEGFTGNIPHSVRVKILETIRDYRSKKEKGKLISAIYRKESAIDHIAELKITEGGSPLLALEINLASKETAREACMKFKENPQRVYDTIIELLTK